MGMPYFNSYYVMYDFDTLTIAMSGARTSTKGQVVGTGSLIVTSLILLGFLLLGGLGGYLYSKRRRSLKRDLEEYQEI
jgi:LPXTG-motif cell wall-anchored protein